MDRIIGICIILGVIALLHFILKSASRTKAKRKEIYKQLNDVTTANIQLPEVEPIVTTPEDVVEPVVESVELTDEEKDKIVIDDFLVSVGGLTRESITNKDRFNASLFFPKIYEEPTVKLNDLVGKRYDKTPLLQTCLFITKDEDNMPRNVRMPKELFEALIYNFRLFEFNHEVQKEIVNFSNTISLVSLNDTLKSFDITIGSFDYNDGDDDKKHFVNNGKVLFGNLRPLPTTREEFEAAFKSKIDDTISGTGASNSYRLTYSEGPKGSLTAITKYAVNKEMYLHYVAHFKGSIPTGEEFIEWYEQACDDVTRLTDEPNIASR